MSPKTIFWLILGTVVVLGLFILRFGVNIYTNWLWFNSIGYGSVYFTFLKAKSSLFLISWALFMLIAGGNLGIARYYGRITRQSSLGVIVTDSFPGLPWRLRHPWIGWAAVIVVLGALMGIVSTQMWPAWLRYQNPISFGVDDPLFGRDVGFYVFILPMINYLQGWLVFAAILSIGLSLLSYYTDRSITRGETQWELTGVVTSHLSAAISVVVLLIAWGYYLKEFDLLYASGGLISGAGYSEANFQLFAYRAMSIISVILAILLIYNTYFKNWKLPLYGAIAFGAALVGLSWVVPGIVQQFIVRPNELSKETPYIRNAIEFTRRAYGLDRIEEHAFPWSEGLSYEDLEANPLTVKNIRLWDPRPLKETYRQLQEIRPYYQFANVDVDRYTIDGEYRQMMISPRELSTVKLPARANTWQNRHLMYTHGYGVCLSPVNEIAAEGLPELFIQDIPPISKVGIEIDQPEVYFGELTDNYIITGTGTEEFDYPQGDSNVRTTYKGGGGVSINSFIRSAAFAWKFDDLKILMSNILGEITPQSQILFNRQIVDRTRIVAPFLGYDRDPYITVVDGGLFWIHDAYTTTNMYPYSEPFAGRFQGPNYIRNPVKVVTNSYTGEMILYVSDPEDPIIQSYQRIFPDLFQPIERMPKGLKAHLRYPTDLFNIQVALNNTFHMTDPQVFYNQEDVWSIPKELYGAGDRPQGMESYYVIMKFPDRDKEEFVLMSPVTPANKDNMIAWIFARCDEPDYGKLVAYRLSKDKLVYGPMQIEARIDQNPTISEALTLWTQKGSSVIRGNLLVIPIHQSFLYVEPLYLKAEQSELPELKRVVVSNGERIAMEETLGEALASVFGQTDPGLSVSSKMASSPVTETDSDWGELASEALRRFRRSQERLRVGDFAGYGTEVKEVESVLERLEQRVD